ncbi:MAG: sulfatase [Planctomycetota bacterium]
MILITCDTLRADRLGAYGYPHPTSPNVDAFARESIVFQEAYAAAPWTGASLSSLLSGRMPEEIGVTGGNKFLMPNEVVTIPEILRDAKLATAAVVSNYVLKRSPVQGDVGVQQGFAHFDDTMTSKEKNRETFERIGPDTTKAAIQWLEQQKTRGDDRFFFWVHYQDPHGPYLPPPEHAQLFERPLTEEADVPLGKGHKGKGRIPLYQRLENEQRPERYRIQYDGEVHYFDESFGHLLDWLRANGWYEDTLIVFSSDHGESLGEHGYWFCHGENLNREVVRVPFIVRFPKGAPHVGAQQDGAYRRFAPVVGHLDLWPTIFAAFGISAPPNRGTSLFQKQLPDNRIMPQSFGGVDMPVYWRAISDGRHRVIAAPGEPTKLFDIWADPGETTDLAAKRPKVAAALAQRYEAFLKSHAQPPVAGIPIDVGALKGLKALGYAGDEDEHDHREHETPGLDPDSE